MTPHILTIVGARPQFVKAAVVSAALQRTGMRETLVHTGQHFDAAMSDVFFQELGIAEPDHHLGISGGLHGSQTGRMLAAVEEVLIAERPDAVLVYGDTNSTLAGALAAAKLHIPVAHVEAGLRSFNRRMPEEINRVLTDHVAEVLYAPTAAAVENLEREGVPATRVELVGDVMCDAALHFGAHAEARSGIVRRLGLNPGEFALATVHRQENTDDPVRLRVIMDALAMVAQERPVVLPMHPRTRQRLGEAGLQPHRDTSFMIVEPLGYLDMLVLEKQAGVIATDSGGVQKEAYFFGVPCVTLRDETEWVELVQHGWNTLAPPRNAAEVARSVLGATPPASAPARDLYGDGRAAVRIAESLQALIGSQADR